MNPFQLLSKPVTNLDPKLLKPEALPTPPAPTKPASPFAALSRPIPSIPALDLKAEASRAPQITLPRVAPITVATKPLPSSVTSLLNGPIQSGGKVRKQDFKDVANLPSQIAGMTVGPAIDAVLSLRQALTGKEGHASIPNIYKDDFRGGPKAYQSETSQRHYIDQLDAGVDPHQAFWNTALKTVMDMSILVPLARDLGKFALLRSAPEKLISSEVTSATRQELRDFVSGADTNAGKPSPLPTEIQNAFKAASAEEKVQMLKGSGIDIVKAKPSMLGRLVGITEEEANQLIGKMGGPVREGSAGKLPGYARDEMAPAFGASTERRKPVGFGESIPKELQPLAKEAKKYKSAEEFVTAKTKRYGKEIDEVYEANRAAHTNEAVPLDLPPEQKVKIYRGDTRDFLPGDYATLDKKVAEEYLESGRQLKEKEVLAKDLLRMNNGDVFYAPDGIKSLTDFYSKATKPSPTLPETPTFEGFTDISTHVLDSLEGRGVVSKQFISDLTNQPELKQVEKDIIRNVLEKYPDQVPVKQFADEVHQSLLPLEMAPPKDSLGRPAGGGRNSEDTAALGYRHESITLPRKLRGPVADYKERIFNSPVKTSAGSHHFDSSNENYFAHSRVEDLPADPSDEALHMLGETADTGTRRVIEIQSDLFQKGRLDNESKYAGPKNENLETEWSILKNRKSQIEAAENPAKYASELKEVDARMKAIQEEVGPAAMEWSEKRTAELAKLEPYRNTWHERVIREEVKQAAIDGKTKLQFPTGETIDMIEGHGQPERWVSSELDSGREGVTGRIIKPEDLRVGLEVHQDGLNKWIIVEVLGDGEFKAVPKAQVTESGGFERWQRLISGEEKITEPYEFMPSRNSVERFDISSKRKGPLHDFYEKRIGRFLKNQYDAKLITDAQGVKWWEVDVKPEMAKQPIQAFKKGSDKGVEVTPEKLKELIFKDIPEKDVRLIFDPDLLKREGITGRFQDTLSKVLKPIIDIYVNPKGKVNLHTGFHESGHYVFEKFMSAADREKTIAIAKKEIGPLSKANYKLRGYTTDKSFLEYAMDQYADAKVKENGYENSAFREIFVKLDKILKRIVDMAKKVFGRLKEYYDKLPKEEGHLGGSEGGEEELMRKRQEVKDFQDKMEKDFDRPIPLTAREKRLVAGDYERANRDYLMTARKEMEEGLPRSRSERAVLITEARLADELKKAGKLPDGEFYKAEEVMSHIQTTMETSMPGERVFTGYGSDAEVRGVSSTFPKWVPEHLRSRELFNSVEPSLNIDNISMPRGKRQQELFNVVFDKVDQDLGVDTSELRRELAGQVSALPASKVMERESKSIERFLNRTMKETDKLVSAEDRKMKLLKDEERRQALYKLEAERNRQREQKITEARLKDGEKKNIFKAFRDALFPSTKGVDAETRDLLEDWVSLRFSAKESANETAYDLAKKGPQTLEEIKAYEAGKPIDYIKKELDEMGTIAKRAGIEFGYREGYLPHLYRENREQVMKVIQEYLKEKGLDEFEIKAYMAGGELMKDKSLRLKLNPYFSKERVFPTYSAAIKYGLTPKYTSPAKLIAHYQEELEIVLANNKLISDLKAAGKLLLPDEAPDSWVPITKRFSQNVYHAEPVLADTLNDVFRDENNLKIGPRIAQKLGSVSGFMQEITLSAGVPFSNINYFSTGQAIRLLTTAVGETATLDFKAAASTLKSSFSYIRANKNKASAEWFYNNRQWMARMALEGIDVSGRVGAFKYQKMGEAMSEVLAKGKGANAKGKLVMVKDLLGVGFDKAFNEKTFGSMMPQISVQTFKDTYNMAIKKGMTDFQASKFAADVVRNFTGLTKENLRGKTTQDVLKGTFFAPKFREGVINVLVNSIEGFSPKNFRDASYAKSRALFLGMIITYAIYQLINKKINNQYTWQNPAGREFALRIPLPNKEVGYIEFMPSFLAFPRNIAEGSIALAHGDLKLATQKYGSIFSMPVKLISEIIGNHDYFGNEIYKETDGGWAKTQKVAKYIGLAVNHPFLKWPAKYLSGDTPLYQAATYMLEAPIKFSNLDKEQKSAYYDMLDDQDKKRAALKSKVQPIYEKNQELIAQGKKEEAVKIYSSLSKTDRTIYDNIKKSEKAKATAARKPFINDVYENNKKLIEDGDLAQATKIYRALSASDRKIYDSIKKSRELLDNQ